MDSIVDLINYVAGFFDWIFTYLTDTVVQLFKDFAEWLTVQLTLGWIETKIWLIQFSWGVASQVIETLNISPLVTSYVAQLSPGVAYVADNAGLFDAFNILLQAYVSSIVLRMTGF